MSLKSEKEFLDNNRSEIIELERKLTACPAIAPEGNGDGEAKKCAVLEECNFAIGSYMPCP